MHIDREQTEVRQVVQPIIEKDVRPTLVTRTAKEVELGVRHEKASCVPTPLENRSLGAAPAIQSKTEFLGVEKKRVWRADWAPRRRQPTWPTASIR